MDLFTYLLAKHGSNSSVHGDLFSYLLGKGQSQIYTISGTTINIPDAKKLVSFMMTKESTQDGTPTPDNPVEVKTVKGFRNIKDLYNTRFISQNNGVISYEDEKYTITAPNEFAGGRYLQADLLLKPNTTYTFSAKVLSTETTNGSSVRVSAQYTSNNTAKLGNYAKAGEISYVTFTTPSTIISDNNSFIGMFPRQANTTTVFTDVMLVEGDQQLPYVPYGNNYVNVAVSDGTNTNNYPIPLNNNEIVGIGDYKDELKVDKSGHVFINKKTGKMTFNGSENDWAYQSDSRYPFRYVINNIRPFDNLVQETPNTILSNYFSPSYWTNTESNGKFTGMRDFPKRIAFANNSILSLNDWKSWLSTHNTDVYYPLATPELIDLQTTVDLSLFKGVNNVSNSEDGYMTIEYR